MAGYRSRFIQLFHPLARFLPHALLQRWSGQNLICPVYHLVSDEPVSHIHHLYKVKSSREFISDLDFLLTHYQPLSLSQLVDLIHDGRPLIEPCFFLSFDDGLSEFFDMVAPILEAKGVPATNFLNSAFVDNRALFYRYKISLLIERILILPTLPITQINEVLEIKITDRTTLIQHLHTLDHRALPRIDAMAPLLDVDFEEYLAMAKPYLTSLQIKNLQERGFDFGAHSIDHPLFSSLSPQDQLHQTLESVRYLSHSFDLDLRTFAFPFTDYGLGKNFFDRLYAPDHEIDLSFGSAGLKGDLYTKHLQRVPMELGSLGAKSIIHSELLYFILKACLGKNTVKRI